MKSPWRRIRPFLSITVRYLTISYLEARSDSEGTRLGVVWIPVETLIFAGLLGVIFHGAGTMTPIDFFLYVLAGYVCWNFVSDSISRSTNIIQARLDFAIHNNLSLGQLFLKTLVDRVFELLLNLALLAVAVALLAPANYDAHTLLLAPLILLLCVTSLGASYLVNLVTVFIPDLATLIRAAMRLIFFATPVFWDAGDRVGIRMALVGYNPASYYLRMMRESFGVESVDWTVWAIGGAITLIVGLAGWIAYNRSRGFVTNVK